MTASTQRLALLGVLRAWTHTNKSKRKDSMLTTIELLRAGWVQLAKVQDEKPSRQAAFLSEGTKSQVMPVRSEMPGQHLCKVMPAVQTRPGRQTSMLRGTTESCAVHRCDKHLRD